MTAPDRLEAAYAASAALLAEGDRDRWLASLFLPTETRRHVQALYAFSLEVARVRELVHDPMPGEIRLQWWADVVDGAARGEVDGHPVAAALTDTIRRFSLPRSALTGLIEARRFDLYDDPMPTLTDFEGYAGETSSVLIQTSGVILCGGGDPAAADASGHAGVAIAIAGLLRALPVHARRGQVYVPSDVLARHGASADDIVHGRDTPALRGALAEMREHARHHLSRAERALGAIAPPARPAFVGLGLVQAYLKAIEAAAPFGPPVDLPAWRKPWLLWRYSRGLR